MHEPLVQVCRGIILDKDNNWNIINYSFEKFWNAHEHLAAKLDWNSAQVYEKLDGSLIQLFWYNNQWHVSTSGTPCASGEVNGYGITFKNLFWKTWNELNYQLPKDITRCYIFELCCKENRIVVPHKTSRIVLLGTRDLISMQEDFPDKYAKEYGWECVKSLPLNSFKEESDITLLAEQLDPMQSEGFVVVDSSFKRVKIKSPKYVALHRCIDNLSPRRMLEIITLNEQTEFLAYFPEFKEIYDIINNKLKKLINDAEIFYNNYKHIENQKEFALAIQNSKYKGACFSVRAQKAKSFKDYYYSMHIHNLEDLLELKVLC